MAPADPRVSDAPLVLLGVGDAGRAVLRLAKGRRVVATTRDPRRRAELAALGAEVVPFDPSALPDVVRGADVIASFPPDGVTDALAAAACRSARAIAYVSSTGVYGSSTGRVDDATPPRAEEPRARARLAAEDAWRAAGAIVLRAPALYGPGSGLHVRLRAGTYRLPGDGSGVVSRIHTDDLAALLLAALARATAGATYVVGDAEPSPHVDVVRWLCDRMALPFPASAPLGESPPTLRGSRAVDPSRALRELAVTLRYPSFREGYAAVLAAENELRSAP